MGRSLRIKRRFRFLLLCAALFLPTVLFFARAARVCLTASGPDPAAVCRSFLAEKGWRVAETPASSGETQIPAAWDAVFTSYNALQRAQGFDLRPFRGKTLQKLVFSVLNYPGAPPDETVLATCFVFDGRVVGGDICCPRLDGFMHGFQGETAYEQAQNG